MNSLSLLIFIIAENISLATLLSLAVAALPSPVRCRHSLLPTSVDCYFLQQAKPMRQFCHRPRYPPPPPSSTIFHLTPNLFCSPLHRHRHPSVDCCLYDVSSALTTDTHGPGASRLSDSGHNTSSTKLGLGWERLWLLLWRRLQ